MTIAIVDYDVGNLKNVHTALGDVDLDSVITRDARTIADAQAVILPGVGAFSDAIENLEKFDLIDPLNQAVKAGKPLLGICLGMQLLFDKSYEDGTWQGLGYIPGEVVRFDVPGLKVPHIGWNNLIINKPGAKIAAGFATEACDYVYFVHSYYAAPADFDESVVAYTEYGGVKVPGIVQKDNVIGMQFHPEKSAKVGTRLLENFKHFIQE